MRNGPYLLILAPESYPGKKYRGRYAYEHHVVWWLGTGSLHPSGSVVHHKNHDRHDNRFENLECKTKSEHSADHGKERHLACLIDVTCFHCSKSFQLKGSKYRSRHKQNNGRLYCGKSCQISLLMKNRWNEIRGTRKVLGKTVNLDTKVRFFPSEP
jgi:hypothetical protein